MLDFLLASTLLFGIPIYALLRGYFTGHAPVDKRKRYRKSMAIIAIFLVILFVDWVLTSRGFTQLGLAAPTTHPAIARCMVAVFVAIIFVLVLITKSNVRKTAKPDAIRARTLANGANCRLRTDQVELAKRAKQSVRGDHFPHRCAREAAFTQKT